jgi:hypothetical protein
MRPIRSKPTLGRLARLAGGLEVFLGLGALGGGGALMLGPRGEIIPLPIAALDGSPFETYLLPGFILFTVLGLGSLAAATLVWLRHPLAPLAAVAAGAVLLVWLAVEVAVVGYTADPPLQPFYLLLGGALVAVGLGWQALARPSVDRRLTPG